MKRLEESDVDIVPDVILVGCAEQVVMGGEGAFNATLLVGGIAGGAVGSILGNAIGTTLRKPTGPNPFAELDVP